jgi:uncharacterized protein YggL (DUF469 family)
LSKGIRLEGYVFAENEADIDQDEFVDTFIKFIESKGWYFGGGIRLTNEDKQFYGGEQMETWKYFIYSRTAGSRCRIAACFKFNNPISTDVSM